MNNLSNSLKKFVSNKNTVTILGVLLAVIVLYVGYRYRIEQRVELTRVPYATVTIQPGTRITDDMVAYMDVPRSFLKGEYYLSKEEVVNKFSNYNTTISEGSLFYTPLVIDESKLPDSAFLDIKDTDTVISYKVDMDSTYANSMMPDDYINIYFKAKDKTNSTDDNGTIMFGKFLSNIKILDVKDADGRHVFENSDEARIPAYMLFALPEDMHLLFRKAIYLSDSYEVELILVPNTQTLTEKDAIYVSSDDIQKFINGKTKMVSVDEILSSTKSTADAANSEKKN